VTTGLLRLLPASEAADARREHRADFAARFLARTGHPLPAEDAERWWPGTSP